LTKPPILEECRDIVSLREEVKLWVYDFCD